MLPVARQCRALAFAPSHTRLRQQQQRTSSNHAVSEGEDALLSPWCCWRASLVGAPSMRNTSSLSTAAAALANAAAPSPSAAPALLLVLLRAISTYRCCAAQSI